MFQILLQLLSMFLPSKFLTLPKVSENMEISINSPKTIKMELEAGSSSIPSTVGQDMDESVAGQGSLSSTASSTSRSLDALNIGIESPRPLTPESSVGSEDDPMDKKALDLSGLWTGQSEKVR